MQNGTVRWFDPTKGFGFIRPDIGEKDIFIHKTAVINSGLEYLEEGQKVTFLTEITAAGKVLASSLTLANSTEQEFEFLPCDERMQAQ